MTVSIEEYKSRKQAPVEQPAEMASLEAEEGFIFTFMHQPLDIFEALTKIDGPEYFWYTKPRLAYQALRLAVTELEHLNDSSAEYSINPITLKSYLELQGRLGEGEGQISLDYLMRLYGSETYTPAHLKSYIKKLASFAGKRKFLATARAAAAELARPDARFEEVALNTLESIYQAENLVDMEGKRSDFKGFSVDALEIEKLDFEAMKRKRIERPLPVTGVTMLDGNIEKGQFPFFDIGYDDLITVMGATGGGKSSFTHQVIIESALRGLNIFFANTENNLFSIRLRNICYFTGIDFQRIKLYFSGYSQMLSKQEVEQIVSADKALRGEDSVLRGKHIKGMRIDYFDASSKTADQLVEEALKRHNLAQRSEKYNKRGYGLFVLDHIQDLERPGTMRNSDTDSDRHVYAMKRLKNLAYATNTPVLIVSHVTESLCEKTDDGQYRPTLYSARGSREMALKAQLVLGLTLNKARNACELEVLKRNNGSVGDKQLMGFQPNSYKFF